MIMKVIAYKDIKLNVFTQPFFVGNIDKEEVIEQVRRMCANPSMPSQYFDYDLYLLGEYDDKIGHFNCIDPEFLVSLGDFRHLAVAKEEAKVEEHA